jgi:flagellar hook-associated protein 1
MSNLFSVLNIGTRGMAASQLGMDITGQNISNADVDGYSRKRLNVVPDYRKDDIYGQVGMGVAVKSIERMRSAFLDQQIRRQNQELGFATQQDTTLQRIENIFTEPTSTGLQTYLDQFFDSWQNLANLPADPAARTLVKTTAETLIGVLHNLSGELRNVYESMNTEIQGRVDKVNGISKEIFDLNKEIGIVEATGQNANDSRDKRDKLVTELSKIVDVTSTENDIGQISVATGGNLIVSPVYFQKLETYSTPTVQPDGSTITQIAIRFADSKVAFSPLSGEIKGLFDCRDRIIPAYQKQLDTLATSLVSAVNELHQRGYSLQGYSGYNFFDPTATGASDIALSQEVISDTDNIAAASGGGFAQVTGTVINPPLLNFGNLPVSLPKVAGPVPPLPAGMAVARDLVAGTVILRNAGAVLRENIDYRIDYQQGTIQMLNNLNDGDVITADYQYNTGAFKGPGDNANALAIAQLRQNQTMTPDSLGNPTATFTEYYSAFIGQLGLERNQASASVSTRSSLIEQYQTNQDEISGVSLDEEMANLVKYQHTYSAAARLITIANEMLNTLISM